MKGGHSDNKTKVVIRHLPPGLSQAMLMEQIDVAFSGRYSWVSFRPGKSRLGLFSFVFDDDCGFCVNFFLFLFFVTPCVYEIVRLTDFVSLGGLSSSNFGFVLAVF